MNYFISAFIKYDWTFPIAFAGTIPACIFEITDTSGLSVDVIDAGWGGQLSHSLSLTTVSLRQYSNNSGFLPGDSALVVAFAHGRWK
jgi:hypothetical protein